MCKDTFIINAADYGAIPNDGRDDTEAIRTAVYAAAKTGKKSIVRLEKGIYNIDSVSKDTPSGRYDTLYFDGIYDVTIEGNGATLLLGDPYSSAFGFRNSGNITVKDLTIDYTVTPWVQGEVTDIDLDNSKFVLNVDAVSISDSGKTVLDNPNWDNNEGVFGMLRRDDEPRLCIPIREGYFYNVNGNAEKLSDGVYRITMATDKGKYYLSDVMHKGSKVVINGRINPSGAFRFADFKGDISVENCTIYASVGTSFCIGRIDGDVTIDNCKVLIKPDSGRWLSTNADGIYIFGVHGKTTVINSIFEGLSDDSINYYCYGSPIIEVINDNQIRVKYPYIPNIGDTIYVIDHINGKIRGEALVTEVCDTGKIESCDEGRRSDVYTGLIVSFDKAISGMLGNGALKTSDSVSFKRNLYPDTQDVVVSNNIFRYNNRAGIKVNVPNFEIKNNVIENVALPGVSLYSIPSLYEIGPIVNGTIEGNVIKACNVWHGGSDEKAAQISIGERTSIFEKWDFGKAQGYMHRNLTVKNNTIKAVHKNGIYVHSAQNVVVEDNVILGSSADTKAENLSGIVLRNVSDVKINNNKINNSNPNMVAGIKILEECKNVSISGNKFALADGVEEIIGEGDN